VFEKTTQEGRLFLMSAIEKLPEEAIPDNGLLRFLTCGSVDDGKSTLIGRLLFDSKTILADTLHAMQRTSAKRGLDVVDLSLLTDGLQAEREQGITIDVAYRYFTTGTRKYFILKTSVGGGIRFMLRQAQHERDFSAHPTGELPFALSSPRSGRVEGLSPYQQGLSGSSTSHRTGAAFRPVIREVGSGDSPVDPRRGSPQSIKRVALGDCWGSS
jgi:hypothetical protein